MAAKFSKGHFLFLLLLISSLNDQVESLAKDQFYPFGTKAGDKGQLSQKNILILFLTSSIYFENHFFIIHTRGDP